MPVIYEVENYIDTVALFSAGAFRIWRAEIMILDANTRFYALLLEGISKPVSVIAAIGQHPLGLGLIAEQGGRTIAFADLAGHDDEVQRAVVCSSHGMQLLIHAALGPSDQAPEILFYPKAGSRTVDLWRGCADHDGLRLGLLGRQAFRHLSEHANFVPRFPAVMQGPYLLDASRQCRPFRSMKMIRL